MNEFTYKQCILPLLEKDISDKAFVLLQLCGSKSSGRPYKTFTRYKNQDIFVHNEMKDYEVLETYKNSQPLQAGVVFAPYFINGEEKKE
jgi:hypothetical protein